MGIKLENWREEGSFKDVCEKYSDVSRFIILKTDVQRRGIEYSQEARKHIRLPAFGRNSRALWRLSTIASIATI